MSVSFKKNIIIQGGFSLIEMITVVAIFFVITGIILVNAPQFRDRLSIDLVASEVAINIRSAQVYGAATKASVRQTYPSFGIHFDISSPDQFLLYGADLEETTLGVNGGFIEGDDYTVEETYLLPAGFKIYQLCAGADCDINNLDILYRRPALDAEFYVDNDASECPSSVCSQSVIVIQSVKENKKKQVTIYKNGQIAIENYVE